MAKLITIGDSISQGFMSAAAARTDLSYSTLIAEQLGLTVGTNYHFPTWPLGGMPLNMEKLLRYLTKFYDDDIWGPFEWGTALTIRIPNFLDKIEDYYERGAGDYRLPYREAGRAVESFHNLAAFGFTVADAWQVTPNVCLERLEPGGVRRDDDNTFGTPSNAFYRNAFRILNPQNDPDAMDRSQLDWLEHYAKTDNDGVENTILWLGSNNALGTVLHMELRETNVTPEVYKAMDHFQRGQFNIWDPELFKQDYEILLDKTASILNSKAHLKKQPDWRVFLGTVPAVTVAPIAKGVGASHEHQDPFKQIIGDKARYFDYYVYVPFDVDDARSGSVPFLSQADALNIDRRIAEYNKAIRALADAKNRSLGKKRFIVVDVNEALLQLAFKRNSGNPTYPLPDALNPGGRASVNTKYYHASNDRVVAGGVFSLDGVHPSTVGQGLLAREFLKAIHGTTNAAVDGMLDWQAIIRRDDLLQQPLNIIQEIHQHDSVLKLILRAMRSRREPINSANARWDQMGRAA